MSTPPATWTTRGGSAGRCCARWRSSPRRVSSGRRPGLRDPRHRRAARALRAGRQQRLHQHGGGDDARAAATDIASAIGECPPPIWPEIADGLVLPRDTRRGAIINHDGARLDEPQGGVPEGAAGLFPVGYRASADVELATYRYAALEQAPLYVGAPDAQRLAARLCGPGGEPALARDLLESGFGDFINEPFLEPDEYPRSRTDRPRASPMFANLGGYLTGLLYGFTGIDPSMAEPSSWSDGRSCCQMGGRAFTLTGCGSGASPGIWMPSRAESRQSSPRSIADIIYPISRVATV